MKPTFLDLLGIVKKNFQVVVEMSSHIYQSNQRNKLEFLLKHPNSYKHKIKHECLNNWVR